MTDARLAHQHQHQGTAVGAGAAGDESWLGRTAPR